MKTSEAGRNLIKSFEACELHAYPDPKTGSEPWTVGWGSTGPDIGANTVFTQSQSDDRFDADLEAFENLVRSNVTVDMTQGQFDAMVSITYNVGPGSKYKDGIIRLKNGQPSSLLRFLNEWDYASTALQFLRWVSPGSAVENGLRRRRQAEMALFNS
jgi:lysozyme